MIDIFSMSDEAFEQFIDVIDNLSVDNVPVLDKLIGE